MTPNATAQQTQIFLSTPSGWRATNTTNNLNKKFNISIHALRVEGDLGAIRNIIARTISIHALRVEGDTVPENIGYGEIISIHALRVEGDPLLFQTRRRCFISIHALRVEGDSKNGQSFRLFLRKREKNLPL